MGSDLSVVNAARVSFDKLSDWEYEEKWGVDEMGDYNYTVNRLKEGDVKLINYLAKHKHYSPFNHTFITMLVKAPIYVGRQLVKHEYMPWNEVSRRYVDSEPEFYFPEFYRGKAVNVKQGSSGSDSGYPLWRAHQITQLCLEEYNYRINSGVCAEQARDCLPPNVMTEWYWSGTLKAFHKMLDLRLDKHTQHETGIVAERACDLIQPLFPISLPALLKS